MEKLRDQLVECPDEQDAYYKVTVHRRKDGTCTATIPELGRVQVAKEMYRWPEVHESFAWKVERNG